ncbi:DNA (cytosine-5-)-methyltransferase [uncultured Bacteroides sp.]|jgi:DNA (cytosine-5)-methyltransferase 1|uniref:DNA (cytosine-5-)-methyltransferase n=1 Tax=uncultured Bacteroides sp. TaxID=162156 RepID=UPI00259B8427|nr:DNA (cytosine-5-)-methyltransferase [uncultured Bacteroides sp.]
MFNVVSLFAGIGGICLGFRQAGFNICWANEKDHAACLTYRHNLGDRYLVEGDIKKINENSIPKADVLAAGFPCQSFSIAGAGKGFSDPRGELFFDVVRVASAIQPKVIFLENVENLMEHDNGHTFQVIYSSLVELGYLIRYRAMPTHEYANIPQTRRRIYIVAVSNYELCNRFRFPDPVPLTTSALDWLDRKNMQPDIYYYSRDTAFERYVRSMVTDDRYICRIYNGSVIKLKNRKCPTLTATMCTPQNAAVIKDSFGVRRLTLRESLKFQGFPKDYYFPKTIDIQSAYKQIGNSVSVPVIFRIAKNIHTILLGDNNNSQ